MRESRPDEVMPAHGLPATLLPSEVVRSLFDDATGAFEVTLAAAVVRRIDRFDVRYKARIAGVLEQGRVHSLSGVAVKRGLWIPLSSIAAEGDRLVFHVGPVRKSLPRAAFDLS